MPGEICVTRLLRGHLTHVGPAAMFWFVSVGFVVLLRAEVLEQRHLRTSSVLEAFHEASNTMALVVTHSKGTRSNRYHRSMCIHGACASVAPQLR